MKNELHLTVQSKIFGYLFLFTGIFSFISSLFAWGKGWLFAINKLDDFLLPMADFITTGPLSLISAFGILKIKKWGYKFGMLTAGTYIYSSILVFITLIWNGSPANIQLIIPSITGFAIGISYFYAEFQRK